jgi:DNA-binding IclR family transcriptional regulator
MNAVMTEPGNGAPLLLADHSPPLESSDRPKSVLGKVSVLLSAFGPDHPELSLAELVRRTGLPRSTTHRLAEFLVGEGWLDHVDGTYRVGVRLFEIGRLVSCWHDLRETAMPFMQDLYEATHEIVHLGVLRGTNVLYVDKIGSHRRVNVPSQVGGQQPAHATGLGKAMLAYSSEEEVAAVLQAGLARKTPYTITNPKAFLAELAVVQEKGYAIDREESGIGVTCAAAAILQGRRVIGAISVTGPTYRVQAERLAPAVRTAAFGIARMLGRDAS